MKFYCILKTFSRAAAAGALLATLTSACSNAYAQTAAQPAPAATPAPQSTTGTSTTVTPDQSQTGNSQTTVTNTDTHVSRRLEIKFGPELGVFFPTGGKTADRFGQEWYAIGLGIGSIDGASNHGSFLVDLTAISRYGSNSHIFVAPLGIQYRKAIATTGSAVPYYGVSADVIFADIRSLPDNVHSGFHETAGGSVFLGTTFSKNGYVEARYMYNGSVKGFDLSGVNLTAGLRF